MSTNPSLPASFTNRLLKSLGLTKDAKRWEQLVMSLLRRLELDAAERADAEREYNALANRVAVKLDIPRHDVKAYPQGSMRTQTTISQRGNAKFDLDVVFELSGPKYQNPDSEQMFASFGQALKGDEATTGEPQPRRRCWRLQYPNKPFYFDVTPAVADLAKVYGAGLRVRDPDTKWSPSNPEEFAQWFCERAEKRFPFQGAPHEGLLAGQMRKSVDPLPDEPVGIDDILRRTVQLVKLHRDNFYHYQPEELKDAMPISVIIVTLATRAYENIWLTRRNAIPSPIEVVLTVVEEMPKYIDHTLLGGYKVANPKLATENFADRWNTDKGVRAREFKRWHAQLEKDLEALLTDEYSSSTEAKLRSVFGGAGADAWRKSLNAAAPAGLLGSLLAAPAAARTNPTTATPLGRTDSLA
jgi:hypothetical protein